MAEVAEQYREDLYRELTELLLTTGSRSSGTTRPRSSG
jgi:hypothetical protein